MRAYNNPAMRKPPKGGGSRDRRSRERSERGPGRRMPPPESTFREAAYIKQLKDHATPIVVHLRDGSEVRGHIEYFDRDMIKVTRPQGPHFFVRKQDIRYLVEDE